MADNKPKTTRISHIIEKLTEATALVNTLEHALGGIEEQCNDLQAARDVRMAAYLAVKRLRKIEQQMYALARAEFTPVAPEVRHD